MTLEEAHDILALLAPSLEDPAHWTCAVSGGRLAVIFLTEPTNLTRQDFLVALRLHHHLNDGLLVVL